MCKQNEKFVVPEVPKFPFSNVGISSITVHKIVLKLKPGTQTQQTVYNIPDNEFPDLVEECSLNT